MKTFTEHITEVLKINKDYKKPDDNLATKLKEAKDKDEFYDIINDVVETAAREPDIYDDNFKIKDYFEEWQAASGWWDGTYKILKTHLDRRQVIGWGNVKSFEENEKDIPTEIVDVIHGNDWDYNMIYKKNGVQTDVWGKSINNLIIQIYKSSMWTNEDGRDYIEHWIFIVTDP